jgi:hypothetical protein
MGKPLETPKQNAQPRLAPDVSSRASKTRSWALGSLAVGFRACYNRTDAATSATVGRGSVPVGNRGRSPRLSRPLRVLESGEREGKLDDGGDQRRGWSWWRTRKWQTRLEHAPVLGCSRPGVAKLTMITVYRPRVTATSRYTVLITPRLHGPYQGLAANRDSIKHL